MNTQETIENLSFEFSNFSTPFLLLQGTFGVGKSFLVKQAINNIISTNPKIRIYYYDLVSCNHLSNILKSLAFTSHSNETEVLAQEVNFFFSRYKEDLEKLNINNPQIAKTAFDAYKLNDYFYTDFLAVNHYDELQRHSTQISNIFEKKIDRRVILKLFDVIAEAFIYSFLQLHFQDSSEDKFKVVLIFDNYENCAGTLDRWIIGHLYHYLAHKKLDDFESYEIADNFKGKLVKDFIDFKLVLISRDTFTLKKLYAEVEKDKVSTYLIDPKNPNLLPKYIEQNYSLPYSDEIYDLTLGIPFAIELLMKKYNSKLRAVDRAEYFQIIASKIFERINPDLRETFKLLSIFDFFTTESIKCLPDNHLHYIKILEYIKENEEFATQTPQGIDTFKLNRHYKFFISCYLKENEKEKYESYSEIFNQFAFSFDFLKNYAFEDRRVLRSIAYFKEFDLGEGLEEILRDDFTSVKRFVTSNENLFIKNGKVYSLPQELRSRLIKYNQVVDNILYDGKINFVSELVTNVKNTLSSKISNLVQKKEQNIERIRKLQIIKSNIGSEIPEIQKMIVNTENHLIILNSQKVKNNRKNIWIPFFILAFVAILAYIIGNNIFFIFNELINEESLNGLGLAFKLLAILLLGILSYLLIVSLGHNDKKEALKRAEEFIQQEEERLYELKECLSLFKSTYKEFDSELQNLIDENQRIDQEISDTELILQIKYLDTT